MESDSKPSLPSYQLPPGFEPTTITIPKNSDMKTLFSPANLASKEIWHITLPTSIPIGLIKDIPLEKTRKGGTALSHNGADYEFALDTKSELRDSHFILPTDKGDYRVAPTRISRVLHLQQTLKLPHLGISFQNGADNPHQPIEAGKITHVQPPGLKMRFVPIGDEERRPQTLGFESSSDESEGDTRSPAATVFRVPPGFDTFKQRDTESMRNENDSNGVHSTSPSKNKQKKRQVEHMDSSAVEESPKKRKKKLREEQHARSSAKMDIIPKSIESQKAQGETAKAQVRIVSEADTEHLTGKRHSGETREERVARKAEKYGEKRKDKDILDGSQHLAKEQTKFKKEPPRDDRRESVAKEQMKVKKESLDDRKEIVAMKEYNSGIRSPEKVKHHNKKESKALPNGFPGHKTNGHETYASKDGSKTGNGRLREEETPEERAIRKAAKKGIKGDHEKIKDHRKEHNSLPNEVPRPQTDIPAANGGENDLENVGKREHEKETPEERAIRKAAKKGTKDYHDAHKHERKRRKAEKMKIEEENY
jgi:hypothetical protein